MSFEEIITETQNGPGLIESYRVETANGTGWDVQIVWYKIPTYSSLDEPIYKHTTWVGVSISRVGHFVFKGDLAFDGIQCWDYVGEKIGISGSDAVELCKFLKKAVVDRVK